MGKKVENTEGLEPEVEGKLPEVDPADVPFEEDLVEIEIIKKAKGLKVGQKFTEHRSTADALVLKDIAKIVE